VPFRFGVIRGRVTPKRSTGAPQSVEGPALRTRCDLAATNAQGLAVAHRVMFLRGVMRVFMSKLALVDHEGRPLLVPETPKVAADVETRELTIDELAQREAQRQSTVAHKKVNE